MLGNPWATNENRRDMICLQVIQEVSPPETLSFGDLLQSMSRRPVIMCEKAQGGLRPVFDL